MSLTFVGVGDLHLDSKLQKHLPENVNQVIMREVRDGPVRYAVRNGVPLIVFYGDICDVPSMSTDATMQLVRLFFDYPSLRFVLMLGNHDVEYEGKHSLNLLETLCRVKAIANVKIVTKPTTLFKNTSTPLRILPWPHFDVDHNAINVLHVETKGSQWDHGKPVESDRSTSALCVSGHLHTKQVCGPKKNIHYCGTLYQTNFGEKPDKYFHEVVVNDGSDPEIRLIPHRPKYQLNTVMLTCKDDLSKISDDPTQLYRVFVKSGADLDADSLSSRPNVVIIRSFKSRKDLEVLIAGELLINDTSTEVNPLSVIEALKAYMVRAAVDQKAAERAQKVFQRLMPNNVKSSGTNQTKE